jgi:hypothetical protein
MDSFLIAYPILGAAKSDHSQLCDEYSFQNSDEFKKSDFCYWGCISYLIVNQEPKINLVNGWSEMLAVVKPTIHCEKWMRNFLIKYRAVFAFST